MNGNNNILRIHQGDYYTEGPAVDREGNLYFTTLTGGKILRIDTAGHTTVWAEATCPNGQRILPNGDHLVCDSQAGKVICFDPSGKWIGDAAAGQCEDLTIRVPNDLTLSQDGGFYFTDSVRHDGAVYFFDANGKGKVVARNLDYPNGICLAKDGQRLYIAESYKNRILVMELAGPGVARRPPEVFGELPWNPENRETGNLPDGILLDNLGNLWVAHYGMGAVHVLSPAGRRLRTLRTDIPLTSNLYLVEEPTSKLIVTGGYGEPGPGNVHVISLITR